MASIKKIYLASLSLALVSCLFPQSAKSSDVSPSRADVLADSISRIVSACPGEVGVAVLINGADTVAVNNENVYPMMSVFKVHQALAVCHWLD